jgi:hypothetical protein
MTYTVDDIKVLEKDTSDDPRSFVPKYELPGEIFNQSYPRRSRHTFPDNEKWHSKVAINGQKVEKWKAEIFHRYLKPVNEQN